jgi:hypothetical protein
MHALPCNHRLTPTLNLKSVKTLTLNLQGQKQQKQAASSEKHKHYAAGYLASEAMQAIHAA